MADTIVSIAVERISNLLIQEAAFLSNVRDEVERLQAELKRMQCFLQDADCKKDQDERIRNWVSEIRDLAYDADDAIDTFLLTIPRTQVGSFGRIKNSTCMIAKAPQLHDIGQQINSIRNKLGDIATSMQTYGIKFVEADGSSSATELRRRLRRTTPYDEDEHVIRLESTTMELLDQLMLEDDRLRVVSIVGMGGLGKTTLAKHVYNRVDIKKHFDCLSWAFVSQQFSRGDVLLGILREVGVKWENMGSLKEEEELIRTLRNLLKEKRYLVVLDDIWKEEAWDSLKFAFPKGKKGSKVLFTTRIKEVALYADPWSSPVEPPFLTNEEGWELLSRKAFLEDIASERGYAPEFERMGKEMVRKCGGLPLAIAVLGGLLANKSLKEWKMVQKDINTQFIKLQLHNHCAGVDWILALSYQELPFWLKPCFLYLSQFPEDSEIDKKKLIRMWIAEGVVRQPLRGEGDETMEDVGEQFLEELANRCMVQVSRRDHTGVGIKSFRMHDLMRDMCVSKAREESFLGVIKHQQDLAAAAMTKSRRIAIHKKFFLPTEDFDPRLRSLIYLVPEKIVGYSMRKDQVIFIFKNFKLLRVLNLENMSLKESYMPREISNLIHLRYLGMRNTTLQCTYLSNLVTRLTPLPSPIGYLKSLHTLDLREVHWDVHYVSAWKLHDVVWKLKCLRHLLLDSDADDLCKYRLDTLRNLETLKWIQAKSLIRRDALFNLTNLRNLGVKFQRREEAELVLRSPIFGLGRLCCLKMHMLKGNSFPSLETLSDCHQLTKLELNGIIPEDPYSSLHNLECLPRSLAKLRLSNSRLKKDPMGVLEKLPNLRFLDLGEESYEGSVMVCTVHGFPQLESLNVSGIDILEEWRIEEGAMPCLRDLSLSYLRKLKMIPEGLKFVSTVQKLVLRCMTQEFTTRVKVINGVEGEDFDKVRHIPSIILYV